MRPRSRSRGGRSGQMGCLAELPTRQSWTQTAGEGHGGLRSPLQTPAGACPARRKAAALWHNLILCCRCFIWKSTPWFGDAHGAEDVSQEEASAHGNLFTGGFFPADAQLAKSFPEQNKERRGAGWGGRQLHGFGFSGKCLIRGTLL